MVKTKHDLQILQYVQKEVSGTKMCYFEYGEMSGKHRRSKSRSVSRNTEEHSSYCDVDCSTRGVEPPSKINAQSHGMR
jgi:hypothetical protein